MIEYLRKQVEHVHLFVLTLDSQQLEIDPKTERWLKVFRECVGEEFWGHLAICYTRWSNEPNH